MKATRRETQRLVREMEQSNASSDDEFIDMEISSSSKIRDFEFPMDSIPRERTETEFLADELFYKGKLLPLHLPPRLQMVQRLQVQSPKKSRRFEYRSDDVFGEEEEEKETYSLPAVLLMPLTAPSTNTNTPLIGSCNISPSESCRVSCELEAGGDCFFEWSHELRGFIPGDGKKCSSSSSSAVWSKRLKRIKQSLLGQKIKASRAYLRSIFSSKARAGGGGSGGCSGGAAPRDSCDFGAKIAELGFGKVPSLSSSVMKRIDKELAENGAISSHRKSFSAAIQWHSAANKPPSSDSSSTSASSASSSSSSSSSSCSSSFSFKLNTVEAQLLKRSSSACSELENSINGAIAHCKKSQKLHATTTTTSGIASC